MKMLKRLLAAALAATSIIIGSTGMTAFAAGVDVPNNEIVYENDDIPQLYSARVNFEVESWESPKQYGRFVATKDTISISFSQCSEGSALVEFHRGSYSGPVDASFFMPNPNNLPTMVTTSRNVQSGATYYITVSTRADFIKAVGGFTVSY